MPTVSKIASTAVILNTERQTLKHLQDLVAKMAGMAGCPNCGRIAHLDFKYLVDPEVSLKDLGVQSISHQRI